LSIAEIAERDGINTALARNRYAILRLRTAIAAFNNDFFTDT